METSETSGERTERLVREAFEALLDGDVDGYASLLADDFVLHQPRWPLDTVGREAVREKLRAQTAAFSEPAGRIERVVVDGDEAAVYATVGARHTGPLTVGEATLAPTGRRYEVPQFAFVRAEDGRLAEMWVLSDAMGIAEQTGNLPVGPRAFLRFAARQVRWRFRGRPAPVGERESERGR